MEKRRHSYDYDFKRCTLCPRACSSDRTEGKGFCGVSDKLTVARAALHFWEEPCISGPCSSGSCDGRDGGTGRKTGSGTVFFSGCPLHCVYCQNRRISSGEVGREISEERLREICFELKAAGALNVNLVTPMHFAPQIRSALLPIKAALALPIVVNTGGYDTEEQIACFDGLADVWLPDFKYASEADASSFSHAPDYPAVALRALKAMQKQVGSPRFDGNGMLTRGVLVRHLILPGKRKESAEALLLLKKTFEPGEILLSVMSQFSPMPGAKKPLDRRITTFERDTVLELARSLGFDGYSQERSSAKEEYIPPFDLTGV